MRWRPYWQCAPASPASKPLIATVAVGDDLFLSSLSFYVLFLFLFLLLVDAGMIGTTRYHVILGQSRDCAMLTLNGGYGYNVNNSVRNQIRYDSNFVLLNC